MKRLGFFRSARFFSGVLLFSGLSGVVHAQCRFGEPHANPAVTYRFVPDIAEGALVLHVQLEFRVGASGSEALQLPDHWAGETLHAVSNLRVLSKGAELADGPDADTKIVKARAHRAVVIGYDLKKDFDRPLRHPMQFHAVLMPGYFEFTGSNALVQVQRPRDTEEMTNFDWQKLPADWALATSFGDATTAAGRCQSYTGPWLKVQQGLYAAGDFRLHPFTIGKKPAVLAVRGTWKFSDDDAIAKIQAVVGTVRAFWHDDVFPYFLVTLKPYDQDGESSDGSAFTNAFWMYVSRLDSLEGKLLEQLAHESFHAWDPRKMGSFPDDAEADTLKWFREGPTDYYGYLLTYRAGMLSATAYVNSLDSNLRKFPAATDEYTRGKIISLWLDGTIRSESRGKHSLDDVMFDMVREANEPLTQARVFRTAGRYLSAESVATLERAVMQHGDLPAPAEIPVLGDCGHTSYAQLPTYDMGFDLTRSTDEKAVSGVVEGSPAYAAGLRNGQTLVTWSVYNGNPDRLAKFTIHTDHGDQSVEYYPRGKPMGAWQYTLDSTKTCRQEPIVAAAS